MATQTQETTQRCTARKIQPGSFFSRHSFGTVVRSSPYRITLRNEHGLEWEIDPNILEQEFSFADQFEASEEVSRTRILELLAEYPRTAMTVNFNKKPDPKDVAKALQEGRGSATDKAWLKTVNDAISGEERTMVGYHSNNYDEHKRLHFQESGKGGRLVDPRTVNWLIVNRVMYTVK